MPNADQATFSTHCHDDLGLAVANTLAAVDAGARQVECTINGIGERAGNASLEEVVMATRVRTDRLPFTTGIDTREFFPSSQLLTALTGEAVQANKAIVGRNAFAHEAGIHQDGMLKDRRTYEIMRPEEVGVPQATLVLGQALGPPRRAAPLRADRRHARAPRARSSLSCGHRPTRIARRSSPMRISRRSSPACAVPARLRRSHPPGRARRRQSPISASRRRRVATATAYNGPWVRGSVGPWSEVPGSSGSVGPKVRASYSTVTLFARFRG